MNKSIPFIRIISVILLIATAVIIFSFSAQTSQSSSNTSNGITHTVAEVICRVFYPSFAEKPVYRQNEIITRMQKRLHNPMRKAAHVTVYAALSLFAVLSVITYKKISLAAKNIISIGFCLLFSVSDEIHQLFIKGRSGSLSDTFIDSVGIFVMAALLTVVFTKTKLKSIAFTEDL